MTFVEVTGIGQEPGPAGRAIAGEWARRPGGPGIAGHGDPVLRCRRAGAGKHLIDCGDVVRVGLCAPGGTALAAAGGRTAASSVLTRVPPGANGAG
jgi:hypothetical protein